MMTNRIFAFLFLLTSTLLFGQQKKDVGEFNSLETYDKLNVKLIQSNKNYIEVSGEMADDVEFVNKNNNLKIRLKTLSFLKGENTEIIVHYKNIYEISANEGSYVTSNETLKGNDLKLKVKEGANIDLKIKVKSLEIKTHSGGSINLEGSADFQDVVCNSGGIYKGEKLKTQNTNVTVNAGGNAYIYATNFADAKTRAGGNIYIFGQPEVKEKTFAGGNIQIR